MQQITISITDIEEFWILTDDIVNVLRHRCGFYTDEGEIRFFSTPKDYMMAMEDDRNRLVEKLMHSWSAYVDGGLLNCPVEKIFRDRLEPLLSLILALYRKGTCHDCYYVADDSFGDSYLLKAVTLRIVDYMLLEAKKGMTPKYLLVWQKREREGCSEELVAVVDSEYELEKLYEEEWEGSGTFNTAKGLVLKRYKFSEWMLSEL